MMILFQYADLSFYNRLLYSLDFKRFNPNKTLSPFLNLLSREKISPTYVSQNTLKLAQSGGSGSSRGN